MSNPEQNMANLIAASADAAKFHARNNRAALQYQARYDALMMALQRIAL